MKVCLIACGGLGANILGKLLVSGIENEIPNMDYRVIDGTDANVRDFKGDESKLLIADHIKGAGKIRRKSAKLYLDYIAENIHQIPEADLYILIASASGGSGSVIFPEVNRLLMSKGKNTVNVVLSTDDSREDVKNTYNTLTGLANNVKQLNRPIHFMLEESSSGTRTELDLALMGHIVDIATICGVNHKGLDENDVNSWLDYQQHGIEPQLTMVERFDDSSSLEQLNGSVITILSLLTDQDNSVPKVGAVFNTDGITTVTEKDVHFVTTTKNMDALRRKIEEEHKRYQAVAESLNVKDTFGSDDMEANGMVF